MAGTIIFNTATQDQANTFAGGTLVFDGTIKPVDVVASNTPGTILTNEATTLTAGGHTLTFGASAVSTSDIQFTGSDGHLMLGTGAVDPFVLNSTGDDQSVAYGFGGNDNITFAAGNTGSWIVDGGTGNDVIDVSAQTGDTGHFLFGGAGSDTLTGGHGNDHIYGNSITAAGTADGNDVIVDAEGSNYINGNAGNDTITVGSDTSTGVNRVQGGADNDTITVNGDVGSVATVNGNKGDDSIDASASNGNNAIRGGQGDDEIWTGHGHDTVSGDLGNDTIHVSATADHVVTLTGGDGEDMFDFSAGGAGTAIDISAAGVAGDATYGAHTYYQEVTDFTVGTDVLNVDNTEVTATNFGALNTSFANVLDAHNAATNDMATSAHEVVATQVGGDTYLFYNGGDEVVKLDHVTAANLDFHSFVATIV